MNKFEFSQVINSNDFIVIPPNSPYSKTSKQKFEMVKHDPHYFKRLNENDLLSWKSKFPEIQSIYQCTHSSLKCKCKFVRMKDGSGRLINTHLIDFKH